MKTIWITLYLPQTEIMAPGYSPGSIIWGVKSGVDLLNKFCSEG